MRRNLATREFEPQHLAEVNGLADRGSRSAGSQSISALVLFLLAPSAWVSQHAPVVCTLGACTLLFSALQFMLVRRWRSWIETDHRRWKAAWALSVAGAGIPWGAFLAWTLHSDGDLKTLSLMFMTGVAAAGMIKMVPSLRLLVLFEIAMLGPACIAGLIY